MVTARLPEFGPRQHHFERSLLTGIRTAVQQDETFDKGNYCYGFRILARRLRTLEIKVESRTIEADMDTHRRICRRKGSYDQ